MKFLQKHWDDYHAIFVRLMLYVSQSLPSGPGGGLVLGTILTLDLQQFYRQWWIGNCVAENIMVNHYWTKLWETLCYRVVSSNANKSSKRLYLIWQIDTFILLLGTAMVLLLAHKIEAAGCYFSCRHFSKQDLDHSKENTMSQTLFRYSSQYLCSTKLSKSSDHICLTVSTVCQAIQKFRRNRFERSHWVLRRWKLAGCKSLSAHATS